MTTRGHRVCQFIERYCLIPRGSKVGQPIKLLDFQRKFVLDVYDNPGGTSRTYLSVARKNGKSALIAAIVIGAFGWARLQVGRLIKGKVLSE